MFEDFTCSWFEKVQQKIIIATLASSNQPGENPWDVVLTELGSAQTPEQLRFAANFAILLMLQNRVTNIEQYNSHLLKYLIPASETVQLIPLYTYFVLGLDNMCSIYA